MPDRGYLAYLFLTPQECVVGWNDAMQNPNSAAISWVLKIALQ
jgi:hypothetical protein